MNTNLENEKKDKEILLSIVEEMSKSMTGAQTTKHWADNVLWFDIPPFASKGVKIAYKEIDEAFAQLQSFEVEILETDTFLNGNMGVVCSIQRWNIANKDGTISAPLIMRQTDCFEKQNGEWKVIHEHSSLPSGSDWNGEIIKEN